MVLTGRLTIAIDELRVQMLSTEVLFGFQLESTFKEGFVHLSSTARFMDAIALTALVLTLAALIAAPAQHRLVERGDASLRILNVTGRLAGVALFFMALAISADIFIVTEYFLGRGIAIAGGAAAFVVCMALWIALGLKLRPSFFPPEALPAHERPALHEKIKQMLGEAWVALPGATGIFGFQLIVTSMPDFDLVPLAVQRIHFAALGLVALAIVVLMTPGPVHRLAFRGREDARSHRVGSHLITAALAPLAAGISADFFVAVGKMEGYGWPVGWAALGIFAILLTAWFLAPWALRLRGSAERSSRDG